MRAALKESLATGKKNFELLILGHCPPLTHRQFDVYRAAFSNLLQCAGAMLRRCIDGWIAAIAPLIRPDEQTFTRSLMTTTLTYYATATAEAAKLCKG